MSNIPNQYEENSIKKIDDEISIKKIDDEIDTKINLRNIKDTKMGRICIHYPKVETVTGFITNAATTVGDSISKLLQPTKVEHYNQQYKPSIQNQSSLKLPRSETFVTKDHNDKWSDGTTVFISDNRSQDNILYIPYNLIRDNVLKSSTLIDQLSDLNSYISQKDFEISNKYKSLNYKLAIMNNKYHKYKSKYIKLKSNYSY